MNHNMSCFGNYQKSPICELCNLTNKEEGFLCKATTLEDIKIRNANYDYSKKCPYREIRYLDYEEEIVCMRNKRYLNTPSSAPCCDPTASYCKQNEISK